MSRRLLRNLFVIKPHQEPLTVQQRLDYLGHHQRRLVDPVAASSCAEEPVEATSVVLSIADDTESRHQQYRIVYRLLAALTATLSATFAADALSWPTSIINFGLATSSIGLVALLVLLFCTSTWRSLSGLTRQAARFGFPDVQAHWRADRAHMRAGKSPSSRSYVLSRDDAL
jgi:hypothetical protein